MGTNITGWIEVRGLSGWLLIAEISALVGRDYDMFASLFGVLNDLEFAPVAAGRGLPSDMSRDLRKKIVEGSEVTGPITHEVAVRVFESKRSSYAPTWVTWTELQQVNWDDKSKKIDERSHRYVLEADGALRFDGFGPYLYSFFPDDVDWRSVVTEGMSWSKESAREQHIREDPRSVIFIAEHMSRKLCLGEDWLMVFKIMEVLATNFGEEGVRLVVWFEF